MHGLWRRLVWGVLTALLFLGLLEGGARLVWGRPDAPILVRSHWQVSETPFREQGGVVTPTFQGVDQVASFPATVAAGTRRLMVFGGSSVRAGSRLSAEQEFPALLAARLQARGGAPAEVLNLGRPGVDSHHLVPLVRAGLAYAPAQVMLYLGHNDLGNALMEARYGSTTGALQGRVRVLLHRLRLYHLLSAAVLPAAAAAPVSRQHSAEAPLTTGQRLLLEADFRANLRTIAAATRAAGAELVLVTPISNAAYPPMLAACPDALASRRWQGRLNTQALSLSEVEDALRAHPGCADLLHARGLLRGGGLAGAEDLRAARDADPYPMRATTRMIEVLRDVAAQEDARLLDLAAWIEGAAGNPPASWFVDNLHLSEEGHAAIAQFIATALDAP